MLFYTFYWFYQIVKKIKAPWKNQEAFISLEKKKIIDKKNFFMLYFFLSFLFFLQRKNSTFLSGVFLKFCSEILNESISVSLCKREKSLSIFLESLSYFISQICRSVFLLPFPFIGAGLFITYSFLKIGWTKSKLNINYFE